MLIESLHVGPGPPAVLGWCSTFASNAKRIDTPWRQGPNSFEADVAGPVGAKVIHVPEPLATVELQVAHQDAAGLYTTAAVLSAIDINWLQVLGIAELTQINQCVRYQLHAIMSLLDVFKTQQ
jgi:hypothetical protein